MLFNNELFNKTTGVFAAGLLAVTLAACNQPAATPPSDIDGDGIRDSLDNCFEKGTNGPGEDTANADQVDVDLDGIGDACDPDVNLDVDGDGVNEDVDNCPGIYNDTQADTDTDGVGDACDDNGDGDGVLDVNDNCPNDANADQANLDGDSQGDVCDADDDNDGIDDVSDSCPSTFPGPTEDYDADGCQDPDTDGDGVVDTIDNCPSVSNGSQANNEGGTSAGDACEDQDSDGVVDATDTCVTIANPTQEAGYCQDPDGDGIYNIDPAGDPIAGGDNCPNTSNADQADTGAGGTPANNGIGDACDSVTDTDGDGVGDTADNCPSDANADQADYDGDGTGNVCDPDDDGDTVANASDACDFESGTQEGVGPLTSDLDANGCEDADTDGDGYVDLADNCPSVSNPTQADNYGTSAGDACEDTDGDGTNDNTDNCPTTSNASQANNYGGAAGDACEDSDGDGYMDAVDACPTVNPTTDDGTGCEAVVVVPGDYERDVKDAWNHWFREISCYNTSNGGNPDACVSPDGTDTYSFNCPGGGTFGWVIEAAGTTGGTSTMTLNSCDFTIPNDGSAAATRSGSWAGTHLVVTGVISGTSDTNGTVDNVSQGPNHMQLTGDYTATVYDIRDVNSKVPTVDGNQDNFHIGVTCTETGCYGTNECRFDATSVGGDGSPYEVTYSDTCILGVAR